MSDQKGSAGIPIVGFFVVLLAVVLMLPVLSWFLGVGAPLPALMPTAPVSTSSGVSTPAEAGSTLEPGELNGSTGNLPDETESGLPTESEAGSSNQSSAEDVAAENPEKNADE